MSEFIPHHTSSGDGERVAFVLHGILGSAQNWRGTVRGWAEALPEWRWVSVDLRHHGDSQDPPGPDTLREVAADLDRLAGHLGVRTEAVIGHSFGGKAALVYGREHGASRGLRQTWVLDARPGPITESGSQAHSDVLRVIEGLRSIEMPLERRKHVVEALTERGFSQAIGRWMTTNLERTDAGFVWTFDLDGIERLIADYREEDLWPWLERVPEEQQVHVVAASESDRWDADVRARFEALEPRVRLHDLEGGHWIHVDNPDGLAALITEGLRRL